jgi:hypothetical protein
MTGFWGGEQNKQLQQQIPCGDVKQERQLQRQRQTQRQRPKAGFSRNDFAVRLTWDWMMEGLRGVGECSRVEW